MKKLKLIVILVVLSQFASAQLRPITPAELDSLPYVVLDTMPDYPEGYTALYSYIYKTINYGPLEGCEPFGTTYIEFIVEKNGSISNEKVLKKFSDYHDKEALKVIRSTINWKPGIKNGKPVRTKLFLPIKFAPH